MTIGNFASALSRAVASTLAAALMLAGCATPSRQEWDTALANADRHVGMVTRDYLDPERRNWERTGPRPLRTAVWYPAPPTAEMTENVTAGLFIGGRVAPAAPV